MERARVDVTGMATGSGDFVGRAEPLAALAHRAELATIGRGSFVVVTGPAGIGKSRLCAELAGHAQRLGGLRVLHTACWTGGGAPPLWPWLDLVRRLRGDDGGDGPDHDRFAFFESTVALLRREAERGPLVLIIEDLHAADEGTLLCTRFVARQLADARILLVVTTRSSGHPALVELEHAGTVVPLGGLDTEAVAALVRADGREPEPAAVDVLSQLTGGNPLAVRAILRAAPPGPLTEALPLGVRESATARLRTIDAEDAALLQRAALLGVRSSVAEVAALCERPASAISRARAAGLALDLLVPSPSDQLVFAHDLVAEALVDELPPAERAEGHAAAAAALRAIDPTPAGRLRAAHHGLAAAARSAADRAEALALAADAAAVLVADHAFADADELLSGAVAVAERTGDGRVPATLLRDRAHAVLLAGRLAEAHRHFTGAVAAAAEEGDPVLVAEAAVGLGGIWVNDVRSPVDQRALLRRLREALAGLPPGHEALALRLRVRIATAAAFFEGADVDELLAVLAEARRAPDPATRLAAMSSVHTALLGPDRADLRAELAEAMVEDAGAVSGGIFPLMARCWRAIDLFLAGDPLAPRALADLRAPAEALQCLSVLYIVRCIEVTVTIRSGRLDEAERLAVETLELGQRAQDTDVLHFYGAQLITIRWLQGRDAELLDLVEGLTDSPDRFGADGAFEAAAAALAARAGRLDLARRHLHRLVVDQGLDAQPRFSTWSITMCAAIEAAAALGDAEVARHAYELLAPHAELPVTPSLAVTCFGSPHRFLGVAADTFGDVDGAVDHLRRAVDANVRLGHRPAAAHARADLGAALARRAEPGDAAEARSVLDVAITDARAMGMTELATRWEPALDAIADERDQGPVVVIKPVEAGGWAVELDGERAVFGDRAGLRHLAYLTGAPNTDVPVLELVAAATGAVRVEVGRQEVLDATARRALEDRARELAQAIAAARERGDERRQAALEDELDAVARTLQREVCPNGKSRAFTDDAERARTAVRKAILRAIAEIERALPAAGAHLRETIATGVTCTYAPRP